MPTKRKTSLEQTHTTTDLIWRQEKQRYCHRVEPPWNTWALRARVCQDFKRAVVIFCFYFPLISTNLYELISFILFHFCACLCACWDIELTRASINHSHNIRLEPCSSVWRIFGGLFSMSIGQYVCGPMSRTHFGPNYTMWYVAWLGELRHQAFFLFFFNIFLW